MKIRRILFILVISIITIFLSGYALLKQKDENISYIENRRLTSIRGLSIDSWLNKDFQVSVENALADNIYKRNEWLKLYNRLNMKFVEVGSKAVNIVLKKGEDESISISPINDKISLIKDTGYLVRNPMVYDDEIAKEISYNFGKIVLLSDKYENIDFYIYIPLMANENEIFEVNSSDKSYFEIFQNSDIPLDFLKINNIYDLKSMYFSTDHHWSHRGAYQGYIDIISLLFDGKEKAKVPVKEEEIKEVKFYGSHSRSIAHSLDFGGDNISKYIFELPEYEFFVDGEKMEEYGGLSEYLNGTLENSKDIDYYEWLYQSRKGEIIFDTHNDDRSNILIISDSMSNAIRDVIASHFNKSIFINLDMYQRTYGNFAIENYLNKYEIDKVLFMNVLSNYTVVGEMKNLIVE